MRKLLIMAMLWSVATNLKAQTNVINSSGNVGIGTTSPGNSLGFQNVDGDPGNSGITWYNPSPLDYGIYRTPGAWTGPNYQQMKLQWDTGILLNPGSGYGKSYVDITGDGLRVTGGNVGIGLNNPPSWAKLAVLGTYALGSPNGTGYGGILTGSDGGFTFSSNAYPDGFLNVQSAGLFQIGDYVGDNNMTNIALDDIGSSITAYSNSGFQVSNYGAGTASLGSAYGAALNYGTSYLGFNAVRNPSGSWSVKSDGYHNGGGAAYSNIFGDIYFAPIASVGNNNRTLSDADVKNSITFRIAADGTTYAKKINVELTGWPDYVFKPTYVLAPLSEVKTYIDLNHHLPEMPSEQEVAEKGLNLGEMNKLLTKKVEELTLYLIEKDKEMKSIKDALDVQQKEIEQLKSANNIK